MGEAVYSLKAQFSSKKEAAIACRDFNRFLDENDKAINSNSDFHSKDPKDFPRVKEYFQLIREEDLQSYRYEDEQAYCLGDVLIFSANVGHLGSWDNLHTFITQKYKPVKVVWGSEEHGGTLDALNLYEWEGIVQGILKCKKTLPLLLGIHKDLDELISITLRKKGV